MRPRRLRVELPGGAPAHGLRAADRPARGPDGHWDSLVVEPLRVSNGYL